MIRRTARQRREYLYRKQLAVQEAAVAERRRTLKASLASGKPLPKEVAEDGDLRKDFKFDESKRGEGLDEEALVDDEYEALSGIAEPKLLITTSRDPSSRLMQFGKEMRLLFPTSIRLNRGNTVLPQLASSCLATSVSDLLLLHEHRGVPTALTVSHFPHGPTASFSLHNVVLRHDIENSARGTVSEAYPHLIFEGFSTPLGKVVKILKHLFPPGVKKDSARIVTFSLTEGDYISVRHHVYVRTGPNSVELAEVGPRMEMKLFEIRLGTADNRDADTEWRLNQYTRTAKKKDLL